MRAEFEGGGSICGGCGGFGFARKSFLEFYAGESRAGGYKGKPIRQEEEKTAKRVGQRAPALDSVIATELPWVG